MKLTNSQRETLNFFRFTGIAFIGFSLFYIFPVARTIFLSFTNKELTSDSVAFVGFDNYTRALFNDAIFMQSLKVTFIFALVTGPLKLLVSLVIAVMLNSKIRSIGMYRTIFFMPFIIPSFAVAYVFRWFFHPASGLVNHLLEYIGITGIGWFMDSSTALITLMISSLWGFGVTMIIFLAALQNVPASLYEAGELDGAKGLTRFLNITFPAISPVFFFNVVMTVIGSLRSFDLAYMVGNGNGFPANSTLLYSVYLFSQAFTAPFRIGYASSIAWIMFLITIILTGINFLFSKFYVNKDN